VEDTIFINIIKAIIATVAVGLSIASFAVAQRSAAKAKKKETVVSLLGEKESVAYAALKLLRDGLPSEKKERDGVIDGIVQACVFEGSDRARALLYRVIEVNLEHKADFKRAACSVDSTFKSMDVYGFSKEDLDLDRGKRRLATLFKVIKCREDTCQID
jgi:hypothetical protein